MFVPFLIMLREGLEAALIVSLIASYLKRTQRGRWIGVMWIGVLLAAALCLALGVFINETTGEFPQKEQELFEGIVAVIAVVILTWMVFWMRKVSRNVKVQLEQAGPFEECPEVEANAAEVNQVTQYHCGGQPQHRT